MAWCAQRVHLQEPLRATPMPYFEENPLCRLSAQPEDADLELDLRGLDREAALRQVETLLQAGTDVAGKRVYIRFDPAQGDGRETLFLPLGRRLLVARKAGQLTGCLPASAGDGYHVTLAANPAGSDD